MKKLLGLTFFVLVILGTALSIKPSSAHAYSSSDLIDDLVFDNSNSMTAAQIDSWLNTYFPSSCISTNNGFSAPDSTGYTPAGQSFPDGYYQYGSPVSAGTIIYHISQTYQINPQVLLTKLQNEEQLVDGGGGCSTWRYASAVGYACTDSGTNTHNYTYTGASPYTDSSVLATPLYYINGVPQNSISGSCVNTNVMAGFTEQLVHAAWLLTFSQHKSEGQTSFAVISGNTNHCEDNATCPAAMNIPAGWACYSGYMTQGTLQRCPGGPFVFYDGYAPIDGTSTHMDTGATAALYVYTPHFQSFDTIFQPWFGNPIGPDYAWQINSFSFNNTMTVGTTQTVTLTATNTGRQPWYNQNANPSAPIRLGTWEPGRLSPFASGSWVSPIRPANMSPSEVDHGGTATFNFTINAPTVAGTYVEPFNLVFEGYQWLPWPGFSPTINVVNPYSWQLNSVNYGSGTGYMSPGTTQQIVVTAKNTGTATWSNTGGTPVRLGTWQPGRQSAVASGWIDSTRPATVVGPGGATTVAPNQVGTFTFNVYMPDSNQHYERFNLVAEGTTWFSNDPGLTLYLQGQTYAWQPLWFSPSTGTWTMSPGQHFILTMQAKNTGTATWYKDGKGPFPVHLATNGPENRGSALYTPSWLSSIRPTGLVQDSVPPGGEGTFTFNAVAPGTTGSRFEAFNLVAEGIEWFNDPGFGFTINVQ